MAYLWRCLSKWKPKSASMIHLGQWKSVHRREKQHNESNKIISEMMILTEDERVAKGDAEVCGVPPCWGVMSPHAVTGAPVGVPWIMLALKARNKASDKETYLKMVDPDISTRKSRLVAMRNELKLKTVSEKLPFYTEVIWKIPYLTT